MSKKVLCKDNVRYVANLVRNIPYTLPGQLLVPSPSTLHSLKNQKYDKRGVSVKQKHPVQIDWVSQEDGSHLLTVAIGSKVSYCL